MHKQGGRIEERDKLRSIKRTKSAEIKRRERSIHKGGCISYNKNIKDDLSLESLADEIKDSFRKNIETKPRSLKRALKKLLEDADRNSNIGKIKLDYFEDEEAPQNSAFKIEMSYEGESGRKMTLWDQYSNYATTCFNTVEDPNRDQIFVKLV